MDKLIATFSMNVDVGVKDELCHLLGISKPLDDEPYLWLPMMFGCSLSRRF